MQKALVAIGVEVVINAVKPRKGSFVVTATKDEEEKVFINLLDLPRPFTKLKGTDMNALASEMTEFFEK